MIWLADSIPWDEKSPIFKPPILLRIFKLELFGKPPNSRSRSKWKVSKWIFCPPWRDFDLFALGWINFGKSTKEVTSVVPNWALSDSARRFRARKLWMGNNKHHQWWRILQTAKWAKKNWLVRLYRGMKYYPVRWGLVCKLFRRIPIKKARISVERHLRFFFVAQDPKNQQFMKKVCQSFGGETGCLGLCDVGVCWGSLREV